MQLIRDGRNKNVSLKSIYEQRLKRHIRSTRYKGWRRGEKGGRRRIEEREGGSFVFVCKSRSSLRETHWRRETDSALDFARLSSLLSVDEFPNDNFIREVGARAGKREVGTDGRRRRSAVRFYRRRATRPPCSLFTGKYLTLSFIAS